MGGVEVVGDAGEGHLQLRVIDPRRRRAHQGVVEPGPPQGDRVATFAGEDGEGAPHVAGAEYRDLHALRSYYDSP